MKSDSYSITRAEPLAAALLILSFLLLRIFSLADLGLHIDEIMHLIISSGTTLLDVVNRGWVEMHPPLGHVFRHYFLQYSDNLPAQRVFSAIPALLAVVLFFKLSKELGGLLLATTSTAVFSFSYIFVTYSVSLRNYSLVILAVTCVLYEFIRGCLKPSKRNLSLFLVSSAIAISLHYGSSILIAALGTALILNLIDTRKDKFAVFFVCGCFVLVGELAVLLSLQNLATGGGASWLDFFRTNEWLPVFHRQVGPLMRFVSLFFGFFSPTQTGTLVALAVFCFGLYKLYRVNRVVAVAVLLLLVLSLVLWELALYPFSGNRYCLHLFPPLALVVGYGLSSVFKVFIRTKSLEELFSMLFGFVLVVISYFLGLNQTFFKNNDEFPTFLQEPIAVEMTMDRLSEGNPMITNKSTAISILWHRTAGAQMYDILDTGHLGGPGVGFYFDGSAHLWECYDVKKLFEVIDRAHSENPNASEFYFPLTRQTDYCILTLLGCTKDPEIVANSNSAIIFRMKYLDLAAIQNSKDFIGCISSSQIPRLPVALASRKFPLRLGDGSHD